MYILCSYPVQHNSDMRPKTRATATAATRRKSFRFGFYYYMYTNAVHACNPHTRTRINIKSVCCVGWPRASSLSGKNVVRWWSSPDIDSSAAADAFIHKKGRRRVLDNKKSSYSIVSVRDPCSNTRVLLGSLTFLMFRQFPFIRRPFDVVVMCGAGCPSL